VTTNPPAPASSSDCCDIPDATGQLDASVRAPNAAMRRRCHSSPPLPDRA